MKGVRNEKIYDLVINLKAYLKKINSKKESIYYAKYNEIKKTMLILKDFYYQLMQRKKVRRYKHFSEFNFGRLSFHDIIN